VVGATVVVVELHVQPEQSHDRLASNAEHVNVGKVAMA
jgi:hypothetical protein